MNWKRFIYNDLPKVVLVINWETLRWWLYPQITKNGKVCIYFGTTILKNPIWTSGRVINIGG